MNQLIREIEIGRERVDTRSDLSMIRIEKGELTQKIKIQNVRVKASKIEITRKTNFTLTELYCVVSAFRP